MVDFVPKLHPGRSDRRGPITVPHDIFLHVVTSQNWSSTIDQYNPSSRQVYLNSIKYWMDLNGSCVVRDASTGRFAAMQDLTQCATILPGNVLREDPVIITPPSNWDLYTFYDYYIVEGDGVELSIEVADVGPTNNWYRIDWGDGAVEDYSFATTQTYANHRYETSFAGNITVHSISGPGGAVIGEPKTKSILVYERIMVSATASESNFKTIIFNMVDPMYADISIRVQFGDGTTVTKLGSEFPLSHTYTTNPGGNNWTAIFTPRINNNEIGALQGQTPVFIEA